MTKDVETYVDEIAYLVKRLEETTKRAEAIIQRIESRVDLDDELEPSKLLEI